MSQLVYFSSSSENTQRFIERLGLPAVRIPLNERERIQVDEPYILIVPSYLSLIHISEPTRRS